MFIQTQSINFIIQKQYISIIIRIECISANCQISSCKGILLITDAYICYYLILPIDKLIIC